MRISTQSGAVYSVSEDRTMVRRVSGEGHEEIGDGWTPCRFVVAEVGRPAMIVLDVQLDGEMRMIRTTPVTAIEEEGAGN